jgi:hypothetical protein
MSRFLPLFLTAAMLFPALAAAQDSASSHSEVKPSNDNSIRIPAPAPGFSDENAGFIPPGTDPENKLIIPFFKHLAADQQQFWRGATDRSSPDSKALIPAAAFTGLLVASDRWITQQVPDSSHPVQRSQNISDYAMFSLVGAATGTFLWGQVTHDDHLSEAGLLSGEAAFNSTAITYLLKGITQRPRPMDANGSATFFQGGSSFPSEHAALAWSVASVFAHEYPGPLTKVLAYGLASSVTVARVTGKQHFASDALVGSALGWYFGRQVYRAHHDTTLGGAPWGSFVPDDLLSHAPKAIASPYVPLDSWVYPVYDRLIALGRVKTAFAGMRPWTRIECARLLEQRQEQFPQTDEAPDEAARLYRTLENEFAIETQQMEGSERVQVVVDSIYTRVTGISGTPLNDSFHFGQTLVNDYGRPYGEGVSSATGIEGHVVLGPVAFSLRGEYQQAPSSPLYASSTVQAISQVDGAPLTPNPTASTARARILESTAALRLGNVQLSFGKQSASLGPTRSGSLLLSNNAEPFTMLRVDSVSPYEIPLVSRLLGPIRSEFFIGQLNGQRWVFDGTRFMGPTLDPQPYIHGEKISFQPTSNLEIGMGVTAMFSGPGLPFTWSNFLRTYYSHKTNLADNPGKRFSAFDFTYRVPGLRKWLTVYADSLVVDEVSPLGSTRPSINPGLYFPQVPKIPRLELRVEGLKTTHSGVFSGSPGFVYTDRRYRSGYTNDGNLLGSWIGRAGIGGQTWATYHFSPRNSLELSFRHVEVDHAFLQGGRANDFSVTSHYMIRPDICLSTFVQFEAWKFPLLSPVGQTNVSASFQLEYSPKWRLR